VAQAEALARHIWRVLCCDTWTNLLLAERICATMWTKQSTATLAESIRFLAINRQTYYLSTSEHLRSHVD
jgi:hypothetical protein